MHTSFDKLDALCAVSLEADRLDNWEPVINCDVDVEDLETDPSLISSQTIFVQKLLRMLDEDVTKANDSKTSPVRWGSDGRSIIIRDPSIFSQIMLPKYFKHK